MSSHLAIVVLSHESATPCHVVMSSSIVSEPMVYCELDVCDGDPCHHWYIIKVRPGAIDFLAPMYEAKTIAGRPYVHIPDILGSRSHHRYSAYVRTYACEKI